MQWFQSREPYIPVKTLQPQYFPVSYLIISSADEQRAIYKGKHPPPQFTKVDKIDSLIWVLQKVNMN